MNTSLINRKACSVFGHRKIEITENLKDSLRVYFRNLILNDNVKIFYFGGFGEFDELCWQIVTELKEEYFDLYRIFCLADERLLRASKRPRWLKECDYEEITYFQPKYDYWYSRIYYRNCEIINRSDYVLFYITKTEGSGAYKVFQYAKQKKKNITNICKKL